MRILWKVAATIEVVTLPLSCIVVKLLVILVGLMVMSSSSKNVSVNKHAIITDITIEFDTREHGYC